MFKKAPANKKQAKKKKPFNRTSKVPRVMLISGWSLLCFSIGFGIYNNFTAVSTHTVHEKQVIKEQLTDTTGLESYAQSFAKTYFTVSPLSKDQQQQQEDLKSYFSDAVTLSSSLSKEVKDKVTVQHVEIWGIKEVSDKPNTYSVSMKLTLYANRKTMVRSYSVDIYRKDNQFLVVKLPVLSTLPQKATVKDIPTLSSTAIDAKTRERAEGFLETFFGVYPKADEKELIYYGKNLHPILENLTFLELSNIKMAESKNQLMVSCTIRYRDNDTHLILDMPYQLTLEKIADNKFTIKELR